MAWHFLRRCPLVFIEYNSMVYLVSSWHSKFRNRRLDGAARERQALGGGRDSCVHVWGVWRTSSSEFLRNRAVGAIDRSGEQISNALVPRAVATGTGNQHRSATHDDTGLRRTTVNFCHSHTILCCRVCHRVDPPTHNQSRAAREGRVVCRDARLPD